MSLEQKLTELAQTSTRKYTVFCAYQTLYMSLPDKDKKALDSAWEKNLPMNLIVRALRAEGHKTSSDTVRAHNSGTCRCPKK
jgi:hypothetical protein